jgi:hypothetical protein
VSSHVYEIIRTIYTSTAENDQARIQVLQQTLSQLRLTNIATLDACMNHFTRLIDLTSADEEYVAKLATSLAPCILRPRTETSLSMNEKHAYRLIRDLFAYKDAIFSELKRLSTQNSSGGGGSVRGEQNRPRAISTDESNRKAHMEERTRALLEKAGGSRSRATSPAPSPRGHRRDKSSGGPETRFPVATSLTSPTSERNKRQSMGPVLPKRTSLEVPDEYGMNLSHPADGNFIPNGAAVVAEHAVAKTETESSLEKRNSLGRSGARFVGGRRVGPAPSSLTSSSTPPPDNAQQGVTLVDRPMDY